MHSIFISVRDNYNRFRNPFPCVGNGAGEPDALAGRSGYFDVCPAGPILPDPVAPFVY